MRAVVLMANLKMVKLSSQRLEALKEVFREGVPWAAQHVYRRPIVSVVAQKSTEDRSEMNATLELGGDAKLEAKKHWGWEKAEKDKKKKKSSEVGQDALAA